MNQDECTCTYIAEDLKKAANEIETAQKRIKDAAFQLSALQTPIQLPGLVEIVDRMEWLKKHIESKRAKLEISEIETKDAAKAIRRAFGYEVTNAMYSVLHAINLLSEALQLTYFNNAVDSDKVMEVDRARDMSVRFHKRFTKILLNIAYECSND